MLYSTLEEAYPIANNMSNKNKKKKEKQDEDPQLIQSNQQCSPLQVPEYKLPIDSNSLNSFKKAIDVSLNTNKIMDQPVKNTSDNFNVEPYDYDEYDAYLNITSNNIQTNRIDNSPQYRTTPSLLDYLKTLRDNYDKIHTQQAIKVDNVEHFTNYPSNKMKVDVNLYNLFLFMFIGIIIILLCDQITKLAIVIASKNI
uniref:Uncharacterized protein n=1 Tax=viral metagenome TaxID=1070528 RepID=A0A6C0CFT4_9ZZZZ